MQYNFGEEITLHELNQRYRSHHRKWYKTFLTKIQKRAVGKLTEEKFFTKPLTRKAVHEYFER